MADSERKEKKGVKETQRPETPAHHYTVETLLTWHAPARPFKQRSGAYFRTSILIALLIEVILFLFSQYMLMLVVLSFLFLSFALASVEPHKSFYKISTEGVTLDDHFFLWKELYDFYFKRSYDNDILHIRTESIVPGEIVIPLSGEVTVEQVRNAVVRFLPFQEIVKPTFMEKSGDWLTRNFPLEPGRQKKENPNVASQQKVR